MLLKHAVRNRRFLPVPPYFVHQLRPKMTCRTGRRDHPWLHEKKTLLAAANGSPLEASDPVRKTSLLSSRKMLKENAGNFWLFKQNCAAAWKIRKPVKALVLASPQSHGCKTLPS